MSIIYYYIKNYDTGLDLSFGSDDMAAGVEFIDTIGQNSRIMEKLILCVIVTISPK